MRDPTRPGAELEDLRTFRDLMVDELRLVRCLEQPIEIDGRTWITHGHVRPRLLARSSASCVTKLQPGETR